jgi:hypothetical protein
MGRIVRKIRQFSVKVGGWGAPPSHQDFRHWIHLLYDINIKGRILVEIVGEVEKNLGRCSGLAHDPRMKVMA